MALTDAFAPKQQGVKEMGDSFTFKDAEARTKWRAAYHGRFPAPSRSDVMDRDPEKSEMKFAAAVAAHVEQNHAQYTGLPEAMRAAYTLQAFSNPRVRPPACATVADLLSGWIHAETAEAVFDPPAVHDRECARIRALEA